MAHVTSLINMKGGVGKSTLAVQLAWQFAAYRKWKKKVLVIDLDPQFNASQYLLGSTNYKTMIDKNLPTVWNIFEQYTQTPWEKKTLSYRDAIHEVASFKRGGKIDIVPSRLELAYSLRQPAQKEGLLKKFVDEIGSEYDLIFIDCPPTESLFTTAAYLATNSILVPVKPEFLSTIGLPLLGNSLETFEKQYGRQVDLTGIVFNATSDYSPEEMLSKTSVKNLAKIRSWYVFSNEVRYSRSYPKSAREGRPIFRTSYVRRAQAVRFHEFANEFAQRVGI